jgi:hypothetical protein
MREIKPYRTENGLMKAIDNGGRLYNILSHGGDNIITYGELAKAAGAISTGVYAFLFFDMARLDLPEEARERSTGALEPSLRKEYLADGPNLLLPSELPVKGTLGRAAIIEGYPRRAKNQAVSKARINIAVTAGSGTGYEKVPLADRYEVFEVFDEEKMGGDPAVVACATGAQLEPGEKVRLGGIVRKLYYQAKEPGFPRRFLEAVFYTRF